MTPVSGFHEGELAVQRRAGVRSEAQRLSPMLERPFLGEGRDVSSPTGTWPS